MAITVDDSFISQFGDEVKHSYQLESKLFPIVRKRTGVIGSTSRFQKLGAVSAYTKSRNADLTVLEPAHTHADVTLVDHYATVLVDDLDLLKTNVDIKREYVETVSKAIAKKIDEIIITAATAGSTTTTTNAGAMSLARLLEIKAYFDGNSVEEKDRIVVVGSKTMSDMLAIQQVTSADYQTTRALVDGSVNTYLGMQIVQVPDSYLPLNAAATPDTRVNFAFHKNALGVAVGMEPKVIVEWSPDKHAWWIKAVVSLGSTIVDGNGVVEFEVDI